MGDMKNKAASIPKWMANEVAEYDLDMDPAPLSILDIGANIGAFSLHYAEKWPSAKIFAYEPMPGNFRQLLKNIDGHKNITPRNVAVRATGGMQKMFIGDHGATCSFHKLGRQKNETQDVECMPASEIYVSHELVKIDTEGCELEILENLDVTRTRAIVVEYHCITDKVLILDLLQKENGFELLAHKPGSSNHGVLKFARPGAGVSVKSVPDQKKRKIFIALTGHYASQDSLFVRSLMGLMAHPPVMMQVAMDNDASVERSRNRLAAAFLAGDCTHWLSIDSDIGFTPADVARICSHDELVVGGMYPLKTESPGVTWCGNSFVKNPEVRADGLQPMRFMGTGFLCIAREVFEWLILADGPEIVYQADRPDGGTEYAFFRQGVVYDAELKKRRFLTEDWMFCHRWLAMGGKVFADTHVVLRHAGRAEWPLALQANNPFQTLTEPPAQAAVKSSNGGEVNRPTTSPS